MQTNFIHVEGGEINVVHAVVEDAVLVGRHHAVVLHLRAEVWRGQGCGDGLCAVGAVAGVLVAVGHGEVAVAFHEVEAIGALSVGHQEEAVGDAGCAAAPSVEDALGRAAACHHAIEYATANGDVAAVAMCQEAAHVGAAAGDGGSDDTVLNEVGAVVAQ